MLYMQQKFSITSCPYIELITTLLYFRQKECGSGVDMVVAASSRGIISWAQYGEWDHNYQTSTVLGRSTHAQQLPAITLRTCIYGIVADYPKTKVIVNCLHISPNIKITVMPNSIWVFKCPVTYLVKFYSIRLVELS